MADFVHLHVHTEYSLLDGLSKIHPLVEKAKSLGQTALAITDHGAMYGAVHFFNACKAEDLKAVIGVEAYMSETSRFDKQARMGADQYHLTLLAKNFTGYQNLMKLISLAHLEGFSYKPRLDFEILSQYHDGIICLSGCASSLIAKKLLNNQTAAATKWAKRFLDLFGDDYYLEIQSHPSIQIVEKVRPLIVKLSQELGIPLVATNDAHYINAQDAEAQDALLAIQMRKTIDDPNRLSMLDSPDFYLKSAAEMETALGEYPDALKNTLVIADKCKVTIPTGKMIFPQYPLKAGQTPEEALREMATARFHDRYPNSSSDLLDRLNYELDVICTKGYASYFLIVQDFVNWAKGQGIRVGPGRGSAAGSLISYCLRITSIDPIQHNLPFERFMNPQRPSPPDIDIDIADEHRDDVIRYVADKYGEDHVAQVITFGTMEARAAIRDIGRVLGLPYAEPDKIAKLIPQGMSLEQALTSSFELQEEYKQPKYKKLIDLAKKVEGNARHASVHAAAVIIADKPLTNYTPVQIETRGGKTVTQYDMYALDLNVADTAIGLLKMDFLGLRNLSILGRAIDFVKDTQGKTVDLSQIPLDDPKVYTLLSEGETTGVFQLESAGMRRVARALKPARFSDITAMVALYRPGPMELINTFIEGKHNPKKIKYPHPDLEPVLAETYGIPVYQEQVLQIANVFAGYSLGEADILRRAIGKKKRSILVKEKKRFVKGAADKGYSTKKAEEIWAFIDKFAGYGFNKGHSASYAMIAYQTAYMKVNYPVEYMCALLSVESHARSANREDKIAQAIQECQRMNIAVLPPHINASKAGFSIETSPSQSRPAIRFGFDAIKNVGDASIEEILNKRTNRPYSGLADFCNRVDTRKANKKVIDSLIRAGAFDLFGHRGQLLAALDDIRETSTSKQKARETGQHSLFDLAETATTVAEKLPQVPDLPDTEKLKDEKQFLGVYVTTHPLASAKAAFIAKQVTNVIDLDQSVGKTVRLGGMLTRSRQIQTKKNNSTMAFASLEDMTGTIELVIFPKTYEVLKDKLVLNQAVIITGKVADRDEQLSIIVDNLEVIGQPPRLETPPGNLIIIPRSTDQSVIGRLGAELKNHPGPDQVTIRLGTDAYASNLTLPYTVAFDDKLKKRLSIILGHPLE